jgi:hypothetical protein
MPGRGIKRRTAASAPGCVALSDAAVAVLLIGIGSRRDWLSYFPPTPPDMRVRIRRFGELRLALDEARHSELIEVRRGQGKMQGCVASDPPPVAGKSSRHRGDVLRHPTPP